MTEKKISTSLIMVCVVGTCISVRLTYNSISQLVTLIKDYRRQEEEEWREKCKDSERDEDECEEGEGVDTVF